MRISITISYYLFIILTTSYIALTFAALNVEFNNPDLAQVYVKDSVYILNLKNIQGKDISITAQSDTNVQKISLNFTGLPKITGKVNFSDFLHSLIFIIKFFNYNFVLISFR